jgi:hypothetical protein
MKLIIGYLLSLVVLAILIIGVGVGIFWFFIAADQYKVYKLEKIFNAKETEFADLTAFLEEKYTIYPEYCMRMDLEKKEQISITLFKAGKEDIIINNAEINSPDLDSMLYILKWNRTDITCVISKLKKIKCKIMTVGESSYGGIDIGLATGGWPKDICYRIYNKSWIEHERIYNISKTELGKRVEIQLR